MIKKIGKIFLYVLAIVFLITIGIFGFMQSKIFKERLRVIIVSELSQTLNSQFYLGTIKGNFITGFSIDSLSIFNENGKFLSLKNIKLTHEPLTITRKKLTLTNITFDQVEVNFIRGKDSIWNINKIFKPSSEKSGPLKWTIDIKNLIINSGKFTVYDSINSIFVNSKDSLNKYLDYRHFNVNNIKLNLSALIKNEEYKLKIKMLRFYVPTIDFNLKSLSADIKLNTKIIEVSNFLVETDSTALKLDASLKDLNLFQKVHLSEFEDKPVKLKLYSNNFSLNELKKFLPHIYFLNGSIFADINAEGIFSNIKIKELNLKVFDSFLQLSGNVLNLHQPKNLFLDVKINNSQILPTDVNKLLPVFKLPQFAKIKSVLLSASYNGTPLNFNSNVDIYSEKLGTVTINFKLNLQHPILKYSTELRTKELDLFLITENERLHTKLNASGTIEGEGTKLDNLNTKVLVQIDTSIINEVFYRSINLNLNIANKILNSNIKFDSDAGRAALDTKVDFIDVEKPKYEVIAKFSELNLGKIIENKNFLGEFNFNIKTNLEGNEIDNLNGFVNLQLLPSVIGDRKFDAENIVLSLNQHNPSEKELKIKSNSFTLNLEGKYSLKSTPEVFARLFENLVDDINKRIGDIEISQSDALDRIRNDKMENFDFQYQLSANNIDLLSKLFMKIPFNFNGDINGHFRFDNYNLSGSSTFKINDYFIGTESKGALISNADVKIDLDKISLDDFFSNSKFNLSFAAEQMNINKIKLFGTSFKVNYSDTTGVLSFDTKLDQDRFLNTQMKLDIKEEYFQFNIERLKLNLDEYLVNSDTIIKLVVDKNGFNLEKFRLVSSKKEILSIDGTLDKNTNMAFNVRVDRFLLENLKLVSGSASKITGIVNLTLKASGSFTEPIFESQLSIDSIIYKSSNLGRLNGTIRYNDKMLSLSISNANPEKENETILSIYGNLPIDLSMSDVKTRFPEESVFLKVKTNGFPLGILNPMIPTIDNLSGVLTCDLQIGGTTLSPEYFGEIDFINVRFLLLTNYVYYNLQGSLTTNKDRIYFSNFTIKNDKSDFEDGIVSLSGYFELKEYKFNNFDLNAKGQLLLLKEGVRRRNQSVYGKLIATTENEGINFKGSIQSSNIAGTIVIKEANLIFPPTQTQIYTEADNIIKYVAVNDTIFLEKQKDIKKEFYYSQTNNRKSFWMEETPTTSKFLNGLTYDLVLYTKGTTNIRMIFNPATNEELYAELDGRVNIQRYSNRNYFIGEILISDRSYYNFFKRFEASGKLKFIGDLNNPELEIKAIYTGNRQVSASIQDTTLLEQKVVIGLDITGSRMEPKLKMSIKIDDKDYNEVIQSGDLQSDAISFLFTNKFRDDLTTREKSDIISGIGTTAGKSLLAGATSTMLSGILTDFLRKEFGFIRTAEVTYAGGSLQQSADLRLSGQIFNAYWRFGGKIFDDINNANVSFILNFGDVFESTKMKNFYLELERRVDGREFSLDKKLTNSAKIYYKWSF